MAIKIVDEKTNIIIGNFAFQNIYNLKGLTSLNELRTRKLWVQYCLYALAYDNGLPMGGSDIKNWDSNAYISEKEGFAIDAQSLRLNWSFGPANFNNSYCEILDTVLHEFFHRYTTYYREHQDELLKLNLDGYYNGLIYFTQPTEMGARQFSIRMMEKLNEYICDEKLSAFIKQQKYRFKEENKNEYRGLRKEGYNSKDKTLYEFKARENAIDKFKLNRYVKVSENNINFYIDSYQNKLNVAIEEYNLNTEEKLYFCITCDGDTLYINNFYGPECNLDDYAIKFKFFEKKAEEIARFYEKQTNTKISKIEISPYLEGLSRNNRNRVISLFLNYKDNLAKTSIFNKQKFNVTVNEENKRLEEKIRLSNDIIKFSSILNRLEDSKPVSDNDIEFLKRKLNKDFCLGTNVENEEVRRICKFIAFSTNTLEERTNRMQITNLIVQYCEIKNLCRLDEKIAENFVKSEEELSVFLNNVKIDKER